MNLQCTTLKLCNVVTQLTLQFDTQAGDLSLCASFVLGMGKETASTHTHTHTNTHTHTRTHTHAHKHIHTRTHTHTHTHVNTHTHTRTHTHTHTHNQAGALYSCASFVLGVGEEDANEYLLLTVHTCMTVQLHNCIPA